MVYLTLCIDINLHMSDVGMYICCGYQILLYYIVYNVLCCVLCVFDAQQLIETRHTTLLATTDTNIPRPSHLMQIAKYIFFIFIFFKALILIRGEKKSFFTYAQI